MFEWNTNNIIDATGGRREGNWAHSLNISTDTRSIKKGDLFIALKGKNFDGHNFLHEAFLKGAASAVVSDDRYRSFPLIVVQDTLKALHDMASYYIRNVLVNAKVIAITGSVGKTTTKDMLHTVLLQYGVSHVNEGNLNNNIGLPLTILKAPENCQYLILEMGMNKAGEIKELSKISNPDIAVITNIEPAHVENFSSLFDIAQAKLEVLYGIKNNATLVLNRDSKYYDYLLSCADRDVISFGKDKSATVCLLDIIRNDESSVIPVSGHWDPGNSIENKRIRRLYSNPASRTGNRAAHGLGLKIRLDNNQIINCNLPVQGEHFAYSVLAVAAIVQSLGLDLLKLPLALENFSVTKGRGSVHKAKYNGKYIHLIDDSYNASPASMKAAIRTLGTYSNRRKVALFGDMLELGNESVEFHTELLDSIIEYNVNKVYTVGKFMLELHKLLSGNIKGTYFNDSNQLKNNLANIVQNDDVVLVKGSRGVGMDLVIQEFVIEY
ncbi:UDP-N-acetylmuramoyl-tripeptide--D-alanyl-D-alanine ligase [Wolbachia endosymbiont of Atemnus politus]|uniref:UDP-N-acetylmuramoyl-tripeptide--D-alanyl-D- alanine ligase n=1 Tax=Wolbachia endosymbiont of Atemnus politus TaxID=2682840 RepID=UPI0015720DAB|nr:UDP-N-acetylmuramoyl-tripeptide--D-alanyl-D-alanine ligase [Wolbachia endosymbiont of Atemnus politus]NSM56446.1 UDP-N-acetylmuramoyl-tripeptide--D-alanyl-D-alanine ligase [Wolbachia endosymbiont of Atemnus politus]NSX83075.1 UDP-N-acetylmuramoyl-tripeptide--D-alanyl-D-alanine ligase [Wolbachia endosymbiont of Atemnus politus]